MIPEELEKAILPDRPSQALVKKYDLAPDRDDRLGGELAHIVVMQHVSKERLRAFLDELQIEAIQ